MGLAHVIFLRLRHPTLCSLQARDPGPPVVHFQSKPKGLRARGACL